jgi:pantoate--beta-alanine ligase
VQIIQSPSEMQCVARDLARPMAFVPTMGALHGGHLALVSRAHDLVRSGGTVAASIFINPTQFGPGEDLQQYPRSFDRDCQLLDTAGCKVVFAPAPEAMYAADASVTVRERFLSQTLCGLARPGHFDGVCLVVAKLFHLLQPDFALFGQKDFQQLAIIRRIVRDLNFAVNIVAVPTVREPDGLALSSRNAYLSKDERQQASVLYRVLQGAADKWRRGDVTRAEIEDWMAAQLRQAPLARVDYAVAVDPATLQPTSDLTCPVLLAVAVFFGKTRLIDNYLLP